MNGLPCCEDVALHHHNRNNSSKCSVVYVIISKSPDTRLVPISIRAISMHKIESRDILNRKYLSKTILNVLIYRNKMEEIVQNRYQRSFIS